MTHIFAKIALALVFPCFCAGQSLKTPEAPALTAPEVLDRYLASSPDSQPGCSGLAFAVEIDASLPHLKKRGSMSGSRLVSQTGNVVYHDLQFRGDNLIKTNVIARFLASDTALSTGFGSAGVTRQNYAFVYESTSDYNGLKAFVFRLEPKRKRVGLLKGELWLDANTAAPLRLWGDFVKSPSIFVRSFRFVLDYQDIHECFQPLRLIVTAQTRIVGEADVTVWMRSSDSRLPAATGAGEIGGRQ